MSAGTVQRLGEYELRREIGRGGMGVVYEAWHPRLGRRVAVKTFVFGPEVNSRERARFNVEVQAAARLQHSTIATVFEAGESDGRPFYAMEFVDGGSLGAALREGPWEARKAARLIRDAALAVGYAHQQEVIHRDLKPANVLLDTEGRPKIVDFGLAKCLDSGTDLTRTGQVMGTAAYMAPEQAMGLVHSIGRGVDIYALGAILYELLTGRPPFQGPDVLQTLALVANADPISPRVLQPSVPRDLEVICLKCLHKSANRRYMTAEELAADIDRFLNGQSILARPVGAVERSWKWMKRRPAIASLIAFALIFVITLIVGLIHIQTTLDEAERNLALFYRAVEKLSVDLADNLSEIPASEEVRAELLSTARELYAALSQMRPHDNDGRFLMAASLDHLGRISRELGRSDEARTAFHDALEQFDILLEAEPDNHEYLMGAAAVHNNLSEIAAMPEDRVRELELALQLMPNSTDRDYRRQKGATLNNLVLALRGVGDQESADRRQQEALALREQLHADYPDEIQFAVDVAVSRSARGQMHFAAGDLQPAHDEFARADALLADIEQQLDREGRFIFARVRANLAACLEAMDDYEGARRLYSQAVEVAAKLAQDFSGVVEYQLLHIRLEVYLAEACSLTGDSEAYAEHLRIARDLSAPLAETGNRDAILLHRRCVQRLSVLDQTLLGPIEAEAPSAPCL